MSQGRWYEQMWSPQREVIEDDWRAAETSFACALVGVALTFTDGRALGLGAALLIFTVIIGINGLWLAWCNRYALGAILASIGILISAIRIDEGVRALSDAFGV